MKRQILDGQHGPGKIAPFERLLDAICTDVRVDVFTRWVPDEVAAGASDPGVFHVVKARGGSLHLVDDLLAKLFAIDNREILVGSAATTSASSASHRSRSDRAICTRAGQRCRS